MNISLRTKDCYIAELTVESEHTKVTEDVLCRSKERGYYIEDSEIEKLITVAFEMARFNRQSDVDTLKKIFDAFLNDGERQQFIESVIEPA